MMTDNEIIKTDEQIIKALEQHYINKGDRVLIKNTLDFINRLKSANKKNERVIELDEKLIKTQSTEIEKLREEVKVLKEIQQKVLSEQGTYTTNDKTVCSDCENLWSKTLLEHQAEIDFLRASKNLHEAEFNEAKVELELKKAEIEKVREANRFYERSRLNCQILTLEAFAKNLKNVFVNIDGTFECQEIEDHIDDFLNRTVNEAKKDYRAICQDDKSSYDLINKTKSEAIKEFEKLVTRRLNCNTPRGAYLLNIMNEVKKEMVGDE